MRHIKCYTSQQNIPGETFIMLKIKKSWVFGEISEIISTSPGDGCACQIPEVKKYAESRQELIAMIRQHMRLWSISERNVLLICTGQDSIQFSVSR